MKRSLLRAQLRAVMPRGVVLHASSFSFKGMGYVFLAPSGGGKTTLAIEAVKRGMVLLGDDSVVICTGTDDLVRCLPCGSSRQRMGKDDVPGALLHSFYFLEKGLPYFAADLPGSYGFYRAMRISSIMAFGDIAEDETIPPAAYLRFLMENYPVHLVRDSKGFSSILDGIVTCGP